MCRLRPPEVENARLKEILAEQALDMKKAIGPQAEHEAVRVARRRET